MYAGGFANKSPRIFFGRTNGGGFLLFLLSFDALYA